MAEESPISKVWVQRELGVNLGDLGSITPQDVMYICNYFHAFIQAVNSDAVLSDENTIKFIDVESTGWTIHYYGSAISTACSQSDPDKNASLDRTVSGQIKTIEKMAEVIAEKGWESAEIIAGTDIMKRSFWLESQRYGFGLQGFDPTASDEKFLEMVKKQVEGSGQTWERPIKKPTYAVGGS